jgi:hypothetical protein
MMQVVTISGGLGRVVAYHRPPTSHWTIAVTPVPLDDGVGSAPSARRHQAASNSVGANRADSSIDQRIG